LKFNSNFDFSIAMDLLLPYAVNATTDPDPWQGTDRLECQYRPPKGFFGMKFFIENLHTLA
jgi:hypothetical protein